MFKSRLLFLIVVTTLLAACARHPEPDMRHTRIRPLEYGGELLLPGGELLEDKDFQAFFKKADYVLLGETHTNMTDHLSQAVILEKLAQRRLQPVIGMEFVDVDGQPVLDRFNRGEITADQLAEALDWDRAVGYSFELYRPIFEVAARYKLPVYALNLPRRVVREARLNGLDKIPEADKKYLPARFIGMSEAQRAHLSKFFARHIEHNAAPGMAPYGPASAPPDVSAKAASGREAEKNGTVEGFLTAQALWDSAMAERAAEVRRSGGRPVAIIVGQGHVEYGWGIALRLAAYDQGARIVTVLPWRAPLESAFMRQEDSPLLDSGLPAVFPPADLADVFYYSPLLAVGRAPQGLVTGPDPASDEGRLLVLSVLPGGAAEKAGFAAGDVILSVERREIKGGEDFYAQLARAAAYGRQPSVTVRRGAEKLTLSLPAW